MKVHTLTLILAAIALLVSCSVEQADVSQVSPSAKGKAYIEVTAAQPMTPETRMTYAEDGVTAKPGMTVKWSPHEKLAVASYSGVKGNVTLNTLSKNDYIESNNDVAATSATFAGTINNESTGALAGRYSFYYPVANASGYIYCNMVRYDYNEQKTALTSGMGNPDTMSDLDVLYTEQAANPADGIVLKRASSILRFVLKLPNGSQKISRIELSARTSVFYESLELTLGNDGTITPGYFFPRSIVKLDVTGDSEDGKERIITVYMLTPGQVDLSGQTVRVSAIAVGVSGRETIYSHVYTIPKGSTTLAEGETHSFASAEALTVENRWAGSNIYWDGEKTHFRPCRKQRPPILPRRLFQMGQPGGNIAGND
jgi:plastocyanin